MSITLKVNGQRHTLDLDPSTPLLFALSDDLALGDVVRETRCVWRIFIWNFLSKRHFLRSAGSRDPWLTAIRPCLLRKGGPAPGTPNHWNQMV